MKKRVLGQINPPITTLSDLYIVPKKSTAVSSTLSVCNTGSTATTFRVAVRPYGKAVSKKHYISYDTIIAGNDAIFMTIGLTLSSGDIVSVYAGSANLSFSLFGEYDEISDWVRPIDWPDLPNVVSGEQKFVGLYAVYDAVGQYVALMVSGNYIVDWGDGSSPENVSAGVKAQHEYSYATCGGAICSRGYKAVVISVTPQSGQNITSFLDQRHSSDPSAGSRWLDITICSRYMTSMSFRGAVLERVYIIDHAVTNMSFMFYTCSSLTSVPLFDTGLVMYMGYMFYGCSSLTSVPLFDTRLVTNMSYMFSGCSSLPSVPAFDTGLVTDMYAMFAFCSSLTTVPAFNTGLVTSMGSMFYGCALLTTVPAFNTHLVTNMSDMFSGCSSLTSVPLFDTHLVTGMGNMFYACSSLMSVPAFDTGLVRDMGDMFSSCSSLTSVPLFDTGLVTDTGRMFYNCTLLTSVPAFDTSLVTNMASMFQSCSSLTSVPLFDTGLVTNMGGMFSGCSSLPSVPAFDTSLVTNMANMFFVCLSLTTVPAFDTHLVTDMSYMFAGCSSLTSNLMTGTKVDVSVAGEQLSASALNTLFTNLGTVSGKTITITGNPGAGTCTQSIATGKGWTVVN